MIDGMRPHRQPAALNKDRLPERRSNIDSWRESQTLAAVDIARKRIFLRFQGYLSLEEALRLKSEYQKAIEEVGPGFTVVSYFSHFVPGAEEVQDVISSMIEMASASGCRKAARVSPDGVLGPLQLNRLSRERATYPFKHFTSWHDALMYLDSEEG